MEYSKLQGCITALITPMHEDGKIDYRKLDMLIEDQVNAGCGILTCGTTGQGWALTEEEHIGLVEYIHKRINGRTTYMISAGSNSTAQAIHLTNRIENAIGPQTFLHATGYYNTPPQQGIIRHYESLADSLKEGSNIVMYNVPSRTGSYIQPSTIAYLASNPAIIGLKQTGEYSEDNWRSYDNFRVLSGEDMLIRESYDKFGNGGVISATANVSPKEVMEIINMYSFGSTRETITELNAREEETEYLYQDIRPIIETVFSAKNPIPLAHFFNTNVRLPLVKLPEVEEKVSACISEHNHLLLNLEKYRK